MALQLPQPLGLQDYLPLINANPAAGLQANADAQAPDNALRQAGYGQGGIAGLFQLAGIGPSLSAQVGAQTALAQQQQQVRQQQQAQASMQAYLANPTPNTLNAALTLNPTAVAGIKAGHDALDAEAQRVALEHYSAIRGNLAAGNTDRARTLIQSYVAAGKAAGQDTSADEATLAALDSPEGAKQAQALMGLKLASIIGPQAYSELLTPEETARHNLADEQARAAELALKQAEFHKPLVLKPGDVPVDPVTGRVLGGGGGAPDAGAPPPAGAPAGGGSGSPRGLRNNNPLNLRPLPRGQWQGQTGVDPGNFAQFATPEAGWAAADQNLLAKPTRHGLNTLTQIIGDPQYGWAPAADHNDPAAYAAHVAAAVGVDPNADISARIKSDPNFRHRLLGAMAGVEVGRPMQYGQGTAAAQQPDTGTNQPGEVYRVQPEPDEPALDEGTLTFLATKSLSDGATPAFGQGKQGAANRTRFYNRQREIADQMGISPNDMIAGTATTKSLAHALVSGTSLLASLQTSEETLGKNLDVMLNIARQGGVGGSVPVFNRWIQAGRRAVAGDPQVTALNNAIDTAAAESAALMTRATGSGGPPTTEGAMKEAHERFDKAGTLAQLEAAANIARIDGHNRVQSTADMVEGFRSRLRAGPGGAPSPGTAPPTVPASPTPVPRRNGPGGSYPVYTREQADAAAKAGYKGKFYVEGVDGLQAFH